ncbi:MAG: hypothetical protein HYT41_02460 [Candidatus Sungbacteria bacterium]|nr:hypothetical protein [Candidatus Sungbacteria bacterium]
MNENIPNQREGEGFIGETRKQEIALAHELAEGGEVFSFPGIDPEAYAKLKADEEEFATYDIPIEMAPIDEIIRRLADEGMKIVLGPNPETGNIYILPKDSHNTGRDSILPKSLRIVEGMDARLKALILLDRM